MFVKHTANTIKCLQDASDEGSIPSPPIAPPWVIFLGCIQQSFMDKPFKLTTKKTHPVLQFNMMVVAQLVEFIFRLSCT